MMMTGKSTRLKILFFIPLFLWTCGGGGGGSTAPEPPQLPTVTNIAVTTLEDTPTTFAFTGTDPLNSALSYSVSTQPQHGAISISGGAGTYTPNANYNGQDVIAYLATSVNGNSNIGTIIITITAVDDEPNTMDVTTTTDEDNTVTITLEAEEVDGQTIQFNVTGNPSNGSVTISGTTATYTPNQDWFGTDTFNFEAVDVSSKSILNNATGTIVVSPINDAPTVDDINNVEVSNGQSVDITLTGSDVENDNLTFEIVDSPNNGTVSISGNIATFDATSVGSDTFTYQANDGTDNSDSATVTLSINWNNITFGGSEIDGGTNVQATSDGGYILTGYTESFGAGSYDMYLVKTDASGNEIWSQTFGGSDYEIAFFVQETSDGGYILVGTVSSGSGDMYLVKTDVSGNEIWSQTFGGSSDDRGRSVKETSDGGYILVGYTSSFGAGKSDMYLVKTDASGNEIWGQTFGGGNYDTALSAQETSDGGYILAGSTLSFGAGKSDMYLVKTDASGNEIWSQTFGGSSSDYALSAQETSDGGYILAGSTESFGAGSLDMYLVKTDASGNEIWGQTFGGSGSDYAYSVQETSDGGYILVGYTSSFGAGTYDMYLVKTDASGNQEWSQTFGGSGSDSAYSVQETSDGGYILTGYTESFGAGKSDMYLVKTDSEGNPIF